MRLISIQIKHFKSLGSVEIDFQSKPLLLVGQNASGKSNIIDAVRFLRDSVRDGLDHAISIRGGIDVLRQHSPTKPYKISFHVEFQQDTEGVDELATYDLKIETVGSGKYRVENEEAHWHEEDFIFPDDDDGGGGPEEVFVKRKFIRNANGHLTVDGELQKHPVQSDEISLGVRTLYGSLAQPITSSLSNLRFSSMYPNTLRNPSRPETDRFLKENGENWASVLKSMKRTDRGRKSLSRIIEMMKLVLPSLEDVHVKAVGGYLVPQFLVRDTPHSKSHYFDPIHLSDGTLRVFGILLALYQNPASSFLAIEEPEQTVNPGVLGILADAFNEVGESTQLVITTHSPSLVDYFSVGDIRVITMISGETRCQKMKNTQIEAVKQRLASVGELMFLDGLQPEDSL